MLRYILQKLVATVPVLLFVTVCVFLLIHLIPGDPAVAMLGENATPKAVTSLRHELGLDLPLPEQYLRWLSKVLTGDLGRSIRSGQPIGSALAGAVGPTFELTGLALLVAVVLGAPAGIVAALRPNSVPDVLLNLSSLIGTSMPTFWSGLILIGIFAVKLGWLPPSGYVEAAKSPLLSLKYMALPALTLGFTVAAVIMRQTRASLLDVLRNDYIRTARSKGLPERAVIWRHALRNALIPVLTVVGLTSWCAAWRRGRDRNDICHTGHGSTRGHRDLPARFPDGAGCGTNHRDHGHRDEPPGRCPLRLSRSANSLLMWGACEVKYRACGLPDSGADSP